MSRAVCLCCGRDADGIGILSDGMLAVHAVHVDGIGLVECLGALVSAPVTAETRSTMSPAVVCAGQLTLV